MNKKEIPTKKIIAFVKNEMRWKAEDFGNIWVIWSFEGENKLEDIFEVPSNEMENWFSNWKKEHKNYSYEFVDTK